MECKDLSKAICPGKYLQDELKERGLKQKEFAAMAGILPSHLNDIIKGRRKINEEVALKIESVLGTSHTIWMNLQAVYNASLCMEKGQTETYSEAMRFIEKCKAVLNIKPILEVLGIAKKTYEEQVEAIKNNFSFDLYNIETHLGISGCYKHSEKCAVDEKNMNTWLALNDLKISQTSIEKTYRKGDAIIAANEIAKMANKRALTTTALKECLNRHGIVYLVLEKLTKTPIDGYSTMKNGVPYITVTYRYNDMDRLAFDVLHELCHIDRHLDENSCSFISVEGADYSNDHREKEANNFARNTLIPETDWTNILNNSCRSANPYVVINMIAKNATSRGFSPSIAVARYKHEMKWYKTSSFPSPKITEV